MRITEILSRNARMYGEEVALVERAPESGTRREITWAAFDRRASRFAHALARGGIGPGDTVVQLMMNSLEWLPVYFGILRTGAWAVPLNFRFTAEEIRYCAGVAEARAMVFGPEFTERIAAIKPALDRTVRRYLYIGPPAGRPAYAECGDDRLTTGPTDPPPGEESLTLDDPAALYFTSGTTGAPKAVLLTHRNLESAAYVENRHHNQTHNDNFLCIPPLYHTGAKMHWFGNFIVGAKAVILKGVRPQWILDAVSEERVTVVWLLVPWAHDILIAIENGDLDLDRYHIDQWRLMHIGAQPVPPSLIQKWKTVFPNHEYDTNYGLTEASGPGCVHLGMENAHKVGAIGVPGFDWECRILDERGEPLADGSPGELAVKGPGIMREYYKNPEATAATRIDGWLMTGDIARRDEDGFIWLVDRKKDVIITGGENIYPVEIEYFLMSHPKVHDVAAIGLPDDRLGEIVAAVVQVKPGAELTEAELTDFCAQLPRYKRPRRYIFGEVPRNPTGKIEKPKLRKRYRGRAED